MARNLRFTSDLMSSVTHKLTCNGTGHIKMMSDKDFVRLHQKLCTKRPDNPRHASVFVPLCNKDGVASVLFTLRTDKVSTHKGEVSFPGGHVDPGETAIQAAVRETEEELGSWFEGRLDHLVEVGPVWSRAGTWVHPVVGFVNEDVGDLSQMQMSEDEVTTVFTLPVHELLDPKCYQMINFSPWGMRWPWPEWTSGPAKVWGMTAYILHQVMLRGVIPGCGLEGEAADMILHAAPMREKLPLMQGAGPIPTSYDFLPPLERKPKL